MITIVCGKPGVGKTTYLAKVARKYLNKGIVVFSNTHILGTYKLNYQEIGFKQFENCLLIVDEAELYYNNRDFKKFKPEWAEFFSLHRHFVTDIIIACQSWEDVDIKLRRLAQKILIVQPTLIFGHIKIQPVRISLGLNADKTEIVTTYEFSKLKTRFYRKRPLWKYFDSFERKDYAEKPERIFWGNYTPKQKRTIKHILSYDLFKNLKLLTIKK